MKALFKALFGTMLSTSVDSILNDFHKTVAKLEKHAAKNVDKANRKVERAANVSAKADEIVNKLSAEVERHHNEVNRALSVKNNIHKLLAI
jgi:flagellar biosynthesis chaperone FliJ